MKINISNTINLCFTACLLLVTPHMVAADDIRTQSVHFKKGTNSATIKGSIKGYESADYVLGARAGQKMNVSLASNKGSNYFNVLPPGSNDEAIFVGSSNGNKWTGVLPADGEYKVRVYLMRNEARRNSTANYTLTVGITGTPKPTGFGKAPASDAKDKVTGFHATGPLPCQMGNDKHVKCEFGVIRGKPGNAEVHITPLGGLKRVITFMGNKVTTDPQDRIKAVKHGYDWSVQVNDYEHYTIPEAVISGG